MRILVTGANGFVGSRLCSTLRNLGHTVVAAVRAENSPLDDLERVIVGAIDGTTDWSVALHAVDCVIHLAARVHVMQESVANPLTAFRVVNVEGSGHLALQAAKVGVKRFIYLSSVKVNGEKTLMGKPFTESDPANPEDAYGIAKLEAEQTLVQIAQQTGMEVVIIRPPLVYGPGVKANFASMLRAVKRGIPLPLGAIHNLRSFVCVDNLVDLMVCCLDHPLAANQIFLVSDGHDLSTTALLQACAVALGVKSRLIPIPQRLIEAGAALLGKRAVAQRLCGNLQVDITKARTLLGWTPPVSVMDGLKATAEGLMHA